MSTRIIHATNESFPMLNLVLGLLHFFVVCGIIVAVLCLIMTFVLAGGPASPTQSAAMNVSGSGIFAGLGIALYCLTVAQALILGKRAVAALEQIADKTLTLFSAAGSVSPRRAPLPPPP